MSEKYKDFDPRKHIFKDGPAVKMPKPHIFVQYVGEDFKKAEKRYDLTMQSLGFELPKRGKK